MKFGREKFSECGSDERMRVKMKMHADTMFGQTAR